MIDTALKNHGSSRRIQKSWIRQLRCPECRKRGSLRSGWFEDFDQEIAFCIECLRFREDCTIEWLADQEKPQAALNQLEFDRKASRRARLAVQNLAPPETKS